MGIIPYFLVHCLRDPPWMCLGKNPWRMNLDMVGSDVNFCHEQPGNPEFFSKCNKGEDEMAVVEV